MRILFLGAPICPHPQPGLTAEQKFNYSGKNSGNLLIGQSIFEEIVSDEHAFGTSFSVQEVNERFDVIVIAAANFLYKGFDFSYLADFLEGTRLPIVMAGLGAQAADASGGMVEIPSGTRRMLSVVSERTKSIGVRGHFTAEVMSNLGFKNVQPIGCPSLYRARRRDLGLKRPSTCSELRVTLNGSRNVTEHSHSPEAAIQLEAAIIRLCVEQRYNYVLQNEMPEIFIAEGNSLPVGYENHLSTIVSKFNIPMHEREYIDFIKSNFKIFFDLESWDNYIKEFDISIGSRFHGNIIALTNGIPAVLFSHDSRTTEMAEFMRIPHIPVNLIDTISIERIIEMADFSSFEKNYCELYDNFARFLEDNGLRHRLSDAAEPVGRDASVNAESLPLMPL